jgi:transposase-like protein
VDQKSKILEILNSDKSADEKVTQLEEFVNSAATELIREDRKVNLSVLCPMCMAEMDMFAEIGFSDTFIGACTCKGCKRSYSVHGNYSTKITRIVPDKETPCTGSQQLRLSGT